MEDVVLKYGLAGVIMVGLSWFIMYLLKDIKKEREETRGIIQRERSDHRVQMDKERYDWIRTLDRMFDKADLREKETNAVIRDVTDILSGLKSIIENRNRKME